MINLNLRASWRCLEYVLTTYWQNVLKTSWKLLENVLKVCWRRMTKTNIFVLIKMSWRRHKDVFWGGITKANILVFKTSLRSFLKIFRKTSSPRLMFVWLYHISYTLSFCYVMNYIVLEICIGGRFLEDYFYCYFQQIYLL